jgi:hypothetical protein
MPSSPCKSPRAYDIDKSSIGKTESGIQEGLLNPKLKTLNSKETQMSKTQNSRLYNLLTFGFWIMLKITLKTSSPPTGGED